LRNACRATQARSRGQPKAAGKVRMEGKDHIMTDGNVVEFRFNV
jgi:ribosome-binding ATPase